MFMLIAWTSERLHDCSRCTCGVWQSWDVNSGRPALELRVFTAEPHSPNFLQNLEMLHEGLRRKISHTYIWCAKSLQFCQICHHCLNYAKHSIYFDGHLFSSIFLCILISTLTLFVNEVPVDTRVNYDFLGNLLTNTLRNIIFEAPESIISCDGKL